MPGLDDVIRANDPDAVDQLLRAGADPNGKDSLGCPALSLAAGLGSLPMTELLLDAGADPLLLDRAMGSSSPARA